MLMESVKTLGKYTILNYSGVSRETMVAFLGYRGLKFSDGKLGKTMYKDSCISWVCPNTGNEYTFTPVDQRLQIREVNR